jgi:hypothetical protein
VENLAPQSVKLRWEDEKRQWAGISIRDKVEGTREIIFTLNTVRPRELLAVHHNRIKTWVLEKAGVRYIENFYGLSSSKTSENSCG